MNPPRAGGGADCWGLLLPNQPPPDDGAPVCEDEDAGRGLEAAAYEERAGAGPVHAQRVMVSASGKKLDALRGTMPAAPTSARARHVNVLTNGNRGRFCGKKEREQ